MLWSGFCPPPLSPGLSGKPSRDVGSYVRVYTISGRDALPVGPGKKPACYIYCWHLSKKIIIYLFYIQKLWGREKHENKDREREREKETEINDDTRNYNFKEKTIMHIHVPTSRDLLYLSGEGRDGNHEEESRGRNLFVVWEGVKEAGWREEWI